MRRLSLWLLSAVLLTGHAAYAQETEDEGPMTPEEIEEGVRGLGERTTLLEGELEKLKRIKISGYVQAEWQHFDQKSNPGGRALYSDARKNFFTVRRGRSKFQHTLGSMKFVLQPDITESGVVIKDAYGEYDILPNGELFVDIGMFNRPNYEVELSSSSRESAERSQVVRAFYPGERDLGFMFTYQPSLTDAFSPKLQLGLFNGPGTTAETDAYKDLLARLTFPIPFGDDSPIQADLGASFYHGGIPQTTDSVLETVDGKTIMVVNEETGDMRGWGNRQNFNIEGQIYLDLLPIGGTILKGEFLSGKRPTAPVAAVASSVGIGKGTNGDSIVVVKGSAARPVQIREQSGFYAYLIQNIGDNFQFVAKYDNMDRNTNMEAAQVTSASDATFNVLGLGVNIFIESLRITAWYEMPTSGADELGTTEDLKDNKTTIRFQYKF